MSVLLVAVGGAAGAVLRFAIDRGVQRAHGSRFPWGTFAVNALGSFVLAVLAASALSLSESDAPALLLGTGLCGALTTFSTFGHETVRLYGSGARGHAVFNVVVTLAGGIIAGAFGFALVTLLAPH